MVEHRLEAAGGYRTVSLPADVVDRVEDRVPHSGFDSVDAYVTYVLEEVLARAESHESDQSATVDEEEVEERLRSLGYLE